MTVPQSPVRPSCTHRPTGDRPPTLAHVAALAGVSPATASRVLSGSAHVSPDARMLVEQAVERLGYVRRRAAPRTLGPGGSIAVVLCENSSRVFADPFFARLLAGVKRELEGGPQLVVLMVGRNEEWRTAAEYLRAGNTAGVLLVGSHRDHPLTMLNATVRVPVVLTGRPLADTRLPFVDADNRGGARAAVEHLVTTGRRAIGTIAGPSDMGPGVDRLAGYRAAAQDAGLNVSGLIGRGDFTQMSGEHAMNRLLERRPDLDAVVAASDLMAIGAMRALRRAGRRIPDDVAVVGFDDLPIARRVRPRLTTVRQPVEDLGARAVRELLGLVGGRSAPERGVVLKTKLIVRDSA
ncbi:LacI family DNA-binding transcriptional regulator [Thermomonospora cellulosilytica]|uniref:DNA-binding LacI/PurR family transcriptional regulator n=1 Tax=Thermomonospora cellulosilytica TaxID=1411118 RepID=A0A7W3MTI2_9ACTN|nr:LacI family DNA-binding transcriptional regulator [Thermomonospora cellulosilytica]MBA9001609.1 DNA-binding LacI/PurR family transcriptional regulator [Thermomonospora cellulosilytica]